MQMGSGHDLQAFVVLVLTFSVCTAHVTLTYPPARKYPFDFMDVQRTPGPCGMSKGLGPVTDLIANDTIIVTWHLAYPHRVYFNISWIFLFYQNGIERSPSHTISGGCGGGSGGSRAEEVVNRTLEIGDIL
ncbi:hypothetical protein MAR_037071 [Mya arenaria]|uniref:Uncharacterized protein n=1 Tax=Mya arenaria TaxID=6604 RepID=A0ABY7FP69_MYAAR|nr:hypothetical protein MAR_037071 [Mya arenaria]